VLALLRELVAPVDNMHAAVLTHAVRRCHLGKPAFEAMVEPCDFVPCTEVPIEFEAADGLNAVGSA